MASSKSIINVAIIGDAAKLIKAVGTADQSMGGLIKSGAKVLAAGKLVDEGFQFVNSALDEADRKGDALARLERSIGALDTGKLRDAAGAFTDIGASSQDMLELEAIYADLGVSAGLATPAIVDNAAALSTAALAAAQVYDADPTSIIEAIGKAVGGSTRGLKEYGVDLTEASVMQEAMRMTGKTNEDQITATEEALARQSLILAAFTPLVEKATGATGDLRDKQAALGAKMEEVTGQIGEHIEGPLLGLLNWVDDMLDAIPGAIQGWEMLGGVIEGTLRTIASPLASASDAIREFLQLVGLAERREGTVGSPFSKQSDRGTSMAVDRWYERNGLGQ